MNAIREKFVTDGYITGLQVLTPDDALLHRDHLERAEKDLSGSLHYLNKVHTILKSPFDLATHPKLLDAVESIIGPDILLYNCTFIIKEPKTATFVSWHQDLAYWGLTGGEQVSAWLALSSATEISGCMQMIPGSHHWGQFEQSTGTDPDNVLLQSQTIHNVDERTATLCPLNAGEALLHHGWTVHCSKPNQSNDRRIGLNIQYITPSMRQEKTDFDTALLVRGQDLHGFYGADVPAEDFVLTENKIAQLMQLTERYQQIAGTRTETNTQ